MARLLYAASAGDYTASETGQLVPNVDLTIWDAYEGGSQVIDVVPGPGVTFGGGLLRSSEFGLVPFYGPDGFTGDLFLQSTTDFPRFRVSPSPEAVAEAEVESRGLLTAASASATYVAAVMPEAYGAAGDGVTDDTAAITDALATGQPVLLSQGKSYVATSLTLPAGADLRVEGTLRQKAATLAPLLTATDAAGIRVRGGGIIDGNKATQTGTPSDGHALVKFVRCDDLLIDVHQVARNYLPVAVSSAVRGAAVWVEDSARPQVKLASLVDWSREGVQFISCTDGIQEVTYAIGGDDSYSGLQASGTRNTQRRTTVVNAGASGIGLDSVESNQSDCYVIDERYFNGFNYGHAGQPASGTVVTNCHHVNNGANLTDTTTDPASSFNVAAGSVGMQFANCTSKGAAKHGWNVSDAGTRVRLVNCRAEGAAEYGLNLFSATATAVNCSLTGNTLGATNAAGASPSLRLVETDTGAGFPASTSAPTKLWVPQRQLRARAGGPVDTLIGAVPVWQLRDAQVDSVSGAALIPPDWQQAEVWVHWSFNTAAAGDVLFRCDSAVLSAGTDATVTPVAATTAVTAGTQNRVTISRVRTAFAVTGGTPLLLHLARIGTDATDTLASAANVHGVMLIRTT